MSNFKEVVKESIEKGIILDSYGEVERFYDYGRYIDLCGLDPKDIVENMQNAGTGGGGSSKTNVVINGVVTEENGEYYVVFNATSVVLDMITISMIIDGKTQTVTMQPGSTEAKFGPVEKYCEIENITVTPQSTSVAKYSANVVNHNGKGIFNVYVSVIKVINNEETLVSTKKYEHKYKDTVELTANDITGYDFNKWKIDEQEYTNDTISFEMPEHDVEIKCYYNIKTFTITWKNYDGKELTSTTINYGDTPVYNGLTPTREGNAQYTYNFSGWTPAVEPATDNAIYTATFSETVNKYTITWKNGDEVLKTEQVEYGTTPSYNGAAPTKAATAQYTYTHNGWTPIVEDVTGDATYTATFSETVNNYTITFKNWEGTVLQSSEIKYGATPVYTGAEPTKNATHQYIYTFNGWDSVITEVTGNATYTAKFAETLRTYPLTVNVTNGTYSVEPDYIKTSGAFSISDNEKVVFSQGNLQYNPSKNQWKIADEQYETIGEQNINIGDSTYEGWVDMFGWSNGSNNNYGANPSNKNEDYLKPFVDWGKLFEENSKWTTLTAEQWRYLLNTRPNAKNSQILAQINNINGVIDNVNGIILLPDDWNEPENCTPTIIEVEGASVSAYTVEQWEKLESNGAIFLPAAGRRTGGYGNLINREQKEETNQENLNRGYYRWQDNTNLWGYYWTSSINEETDNVPYLINCKVTSDNEYIIGPFVVWEESGRYGQSVRLAKIVEEQEEMLYYYGTDVTINAKANENYTTNGKEDGYTEIIETITIQGVTDKSYQFKIKTYTVTFNNWNGEELASYEVEYGQTPVYSGEEPTKDADTQYTYTFSGWDNELSAVTNNQRYTAQYTSQPRQYTVTWKNGDTVLTSTTVNYGDTPVYPEDGPKIEKPQDDMYTYEFSGWDPKIKEVTGDATYTASFEGIPKEYTLSVNVENGTYTINPEQETYHYNDKVTIVITPEDGYEYSPLENIITITGDTTLNYVCEEKKYTLTVDGKVYENIPYNEPITQYLIYEPKEGMSHKWMEGNEEFTGNTMPNRNLTLTSVYEEFTESKMVYYGTDLLENIENFTIEDVLNKNKQEYNGTEQEFIFNYSGASEDIVLEYEDTFDEALEEACQQYYYIAIPSDKTVTIINSAKQEITQYFTIKNEQLIIDNTNYDQYTYRMTGVNIYPETIKLKIIIK